MKFSCLKNLVGLEKLFLPHDSKEMHRLAVFKFNLGKLTKKVGKVAQVSRLTRLFQFFS